MVLINKSTRITPILLNKTLKMYNGKKIIKLKISKKMVNFKIGQFLITKIHKKHE